MKVWNGTTWVDGSFSVAADEVFIGPSAPPTTYELWVDDDDPGAGDIAKMPRGLLAHRNVLNGADLTPPANTEVNLPLSSALTFTFTSGRWWRMRLRMRALNGGPVAGGAQMAFRVKSGGADWNLGWFVAGENKWSEGSFEWVLSGDDATRTITVTGACVTANGIIAANSNWLTIEDIGGV